MKSGRLLVLLLLGALALAVSCRPPGDTGTSAGSIADFFSMRTAEDGSIVSRALPPSPRPREAVTSDDYFGLRLESLYLGDAFQLPSRADENAGALAILLEVDGVLPAGFDCSLMSPDELGVGFATSYESNGVPDTGCPYRTLVSINPAFNNGFVALDGIDVALPFRTRDESIRLRFIIVELRDVELAQQIVEAGLGAVERMNAAAGGGDQWDAGPILQAALGSRSTSVRALRSVAHLVLDRAARPRYVMEMTADFVPVETTEGATPVALLMAQDYIIVGRRDSDSLLNAETAGEVLYFSSGRLYRHGDRGEFRSNPYIVWRFVRYSRYPGLLPVDYNDFVRYARRGDPDTLLDDAEYLVEELQFERLVNELEGEVLLSLFDWSIEAMQTTDALDDDDAAPRVPPFVEALADAAWSDRLRYLEALGDAAGLAERLDTRIYREFGQTPGLKQGECVALESLTRRLADAYAERYTELSDNVRAWQVERVRLGNLGDGRSSTEEARYRALYDGETELLRRFEALPEVLPEPACPGMREALTY